MKDKYPTEVLVHVLHKIFKLQGTETETTGRVVVLLALVIFHLSALIFS